VSDPLSALQKALVQSLRADAALAAILGGPKAFEHVPPATDAPWIAFEEMRAKDAGASGKPVHEHRVTLLCATRQPGFKQALAIAERAKALLDDAQLTLDGHRLASLFVLSVELLRVGREPLRKARLTLRAVTETL
jgi:hypothetical protein